jgi:hypothetical protein
LSELVVNVLHLSLATGAPHRDPQAPSRWPLSGAFFKSLACGDNENFGQRELTLYSSDNCMHFSPRQARMGKTLASICEIPG